MRTLSLVLLPALALAVPAAAQAPTLAFVEQWQHHHRHLLAVIDSATPDMQSFRTTPGVRTFAEQIDHVVTVAARIIGGAVAVGSMAEELAADTAGYLHDRARLRARADRAFTRIIGLLAAMPAAEWEREQAFAGGALPRWRWNLTALQHSAWTLGQTVPYLRMNGRTPPQFTPF